MPFDSLVTAMAGQYTDWHLDTSCPEGSVVFPGPSPVPEPLLPFARALSAAVAAVVSARSGAHSRGFVVEFEGLFFRAQLMPTGTGKEYALRAIGSDIPDLDALGFKEGARRQMLSPELRRKGGLVLIAGAPGAGKTTTASSMVKQRLVAQGGYCLTAEDPPEFRLRGFHGAGYCQQTDIQGDPHAHLCELLRCFPASESAMLFFGEVRDSPSASELLRIAVDGHLVISTLHAGDIIETLQRLLTLASRDGEMEARTLLAKSLRLVVHQRLDPNQGLVAQTLDSSEAVAATIRNGKLMNLTDEIRLQQQRLGVSIGSGSGPKF